MVEWSAKRDALLAVMRILVRAVSSQVVVPVLRHVLVQVSPGAARVRATDLELSISHSVEVEAESSATFTLPAKQFTELLSRFYDPDVCFRVDTAGSTVEVQCGSGSTYRLPSFPPEEFPPEPEFDAEPTACIPASDLVAALLRALPAASRDASRAIINGVHVKGTDTSVMFAATDTHRLVSVVTDHPAKDFEFVLPLRSALEVSRALASGCGNATIRATEADAMISGDNGLQVQTRLVQGRFPAIDRLLSWHRDGPVLTVDANVNELRTRLNRVAIVAGQNFGRVRFSVGASQLVISAEASDAGSAEEVLRVSGFGEGFECAMDARYVLDMIDGVQGSVRMEFAKPTSAVHFSPIESDTSGMTWRGLVMPMSL